LHAHTNRIKANATKELALAPPCPYPCKPNGLKAWPDPNENTSYPVTGIEAPVLGHHFFLPGDTLGGVGVGFCKFFLCIMVMVVVNILYIWV